MGLIQWVNEKLTAIRKSLRIYNSVQEYADFSKKTYRKFVIESSRFKKDLVKLAQRVEQTKNVTTLKDTNLRYIFGDYLNTLDKTNQFINQFDKEIRDLIRYTPKSKVEALNKKRVLDYMYKVQKQIKTFKLKNISLINSLDKLETIYYREITKKIAKTAVMVAFVAFASHTVVIKILDVIKKVNEAKTHANDSLGVVSSLGIAASKSEQVSAMVMDSDTKNLASISDSLDIIKQGGSSVSLEMDDILSIDMTADSVSIDKDSKVLLKTLMDSGNDSNVKRIVSDVSKAVTNVEQKVNRLKVLA